MPLRNTLFGVGDELAGQAIWKAGAKVLGGLWKNGGKEVAVGAAKKAAQDFLTPQEGRDEWLVMLSELEQTLYGWPVRVPNQRKPGESRWESRNLTQIDPRRATLVKQAWDRRLQEARFRGRENWLVNKIGGVWKSLSDDTTDEPNRNVMMRYLVFLGELSSEEFWERVDNHHHGPVDERVRSFLNGVRKTNERLNRLADQQAEWRRRVRRGDV